MILLASAYGFVARVTPSSSTHRLCCISPARAVVGATAGEPHTPLVGENAVSEELDPLVAYDSADSAAADFSDDPDAPATTGPQPTVATPASVAAGFFSNFQDSVKVAVSTAAANLRRNAQEALADVASGIAAVPMRLQDSAQASVDAAASAVNERTQAVADKLVAIPSDMQTAATIKVAAIVAEINAVPVNVQSAAAAAVQEAMGSMKASPRKLRSAVIDASVSAGDKVRNSISVVQDDVAIAKQKRDEMRS
eukprot:CAMPEP_0119359272 /NCGR_PEP_ID=MMETSP1334-20130426/7201_1 /TAXON_ID=127549 /ORGANISM="Calcidiscus leptoporus, Strain RCC1130" /LENGTH=252 /DNA_ID=CAMNT_0007373917 /DNA_START=75 /DNA_END=833 /DNA_ORIENTATION=-